MNTKSIYVPLAMMNGSLIAIMVLFNTILGNAVGVIFSIFVIQSTGLLLTLIITTVKRSPKGTRAPYYLRIGGILGIPVVLLNILCFLNIGASLTLACVVLGQSLASLTADLTGFLGVKTYPFEKEKILGFTISFAGIIIMASYGDFAVIFILFAFLTGVITIIQMIINSQLALRIGLFRSTQNNFIGGFLASLLLCIILGVPLLENIRSLPSIPIPYIIGGGWLGVITVFTCNWILPKIPTIYSSLLQFSGQIITAIIIDAIRFGAFPTNRLIGAIFILAGMYYNITMDKRKSRKRSLDTIDQ